MQRLSPLAIPFLALLVSAPAFAQHCSDVRLDTDPGAAVSHWPQVAASGSSVYATWVDYRNGNADIYFNRSSDGGATWLAADVRIDTDVAGAATSWAPQIAASGSSVHVVWADTRNGAHDVYFNRSLDGGATWFATDVRLDTDFPGSARSQEAQIAAVGSSVYVVWADSRYGFNDVYANRSLDGGATWLAADVRLDTDVAGAAYSARPQIGASGASVYVTWEDTRSGAFDIHFNRSLDGGSTWLAADVRLDTDPPGASGSRVPQILASGSTVSVVWEDQRQAGSIRLNQSLDDGATWLAEDVRLNTAAGSAQTPQIGASGTSVYAVWVDSRNGALDIYFRSTPGQVSPASESIRLGTVPNPNALRPGQTSGPVIGCTWDPVIDHTTFLAAATTDFLCLGTPLDASFPPFGSVLCTLQICLAGPAGSPFAIPIPNESAILGAGFSVQGASAQSFSAQFTNALDVVVGNF